jgi:hypothetical protein
MNTFVYSNFFNFVVSKIGRK